MFPSPHPFHSPVFPLPHLYCFPHPTLSILQSFLYRISTFPSLHPFPCHSLSIILPFFTAYVHLLGVSILLSQLLFVSFSFCCSKRYISSLPHPDREVRIRGSGSGSVPKGQGSATLPPYHFSLLSSIFYSILSTAFQFFCTTSKRCMYPMPVDYCLW
jgi:hypothetical protein